MPNNTINGLWIGSRLSNIERLCIQSYIDNGYKFILWVYDEIETKLPEKTIINDANDIIPRQEVFSYTKKNTFGHGQGSYAGFSDIFRYKLLYEKGGWWTDMDIICLGKLPKTKYFFRNHHSLKLVGNLMKCPKQSLLMKNCFLKAKTLIKKDNTDWHKPIEILINEVFELKLEHYIQTNKGNLDYWNETIKHIKKRKKIPENWIYLHLQNEEWRNRNIDKNKIRIRSTLAKLMIKHKIIKSNYSTFEIIKNELAQIPFISKYINE